ncbi:MAG: S41 family peptidase [Deltaproteobacteria bacterium]|nr:S41 family peptidase [Deltaproteobacteria bacterium]
MKSFLKRYKAILIIALVLSASLWVTSDGVQQRLLAGTDETYEELKIFSDILDTIEKNYVDPVDPKTLIRGAIQGMLSSLDPHSSFLLPDAYKELRIDTRGEFSGIGIVITMQDQRLTVISPIEGSPAYRAGVKAGDHIIKVDGQDTKDMKLWEAVKKMRGKKGTKVVITVTREGLSEPKDFTIVRDVIPLQSVRAYTLKPGYGYLRITNFREQTYDDVRTALNKLESGAMPLRGLVFDLRDNPGGLLEQAVNIADIFIDEGPIVSIKGRVQAHSKIYSAHRNDKEHPYPVVLLINEGSASASEIVAGALQDHGRALVLGTTSFGKGSVQAVEPLRDGSGLKLTIARYYTPNGHSIQAQGIKPDVEVKERFVHEPEPERRHHILEKDLKNHIAAEPEKGDEREKRHDATENITNVRLPGQEPSKIVQQLLNRDNQVRRALEILASWQIFSKMKF